MNVNKKNHHFLKKKKEMQCFHKETAMDGWWGEVKNRLYWVPTSDQISKLLWLCIWSKLQNNQTAANRMS